VSLHPIPDVGSGHGARSGLRSHREALALLLLCNPMGEGAAACRVLWVVGDLGRFEGMRWRSV